MSEHHSRQLIAYRRAQHLTQEDIASFFNVSAATISRWESGIQSPDPNHIGMIQKLLGLHRFNTLDEWRFRVNRSMGYELLFDGNGCVAAASQATLALRGLTLIDAIGMRAYELLPPPASSEAVAEYRRCGYFSDRERLFRGEIRLIKFKAELRSDSLSGRISGDYWPIFTSNQQTYALFTFVPTGPIQDSMWNGAYRIVHYQAIPLV